MQRIYDLGDVSQYCEGLMSNHYDTLGVAPGSTAKEVRKAYLRRARALHPDRQQGRTQADARRAEEAMQQVNVAWNVLSDSKKRSEYDQTLVRRTGTGQANKTRSPSDRRPTPPPRQSNAARQQQAQPRQTTPHRSIDDEPGDGSVSALASLPVLIILGIILGVLIVTAFGTRDDSAPGREVVPELDSQMRDDDCFVFVGDTIRAESCSSGRADAQAVAVVPDQGNCPSNTLNITQGDRVICYVNLVAGSSVTTPTE